MLIIKSLIYYYNIIILLIIHGEKLPLFVDYFTPAKAFLHMNTMKACKN